MPHTRRPTVWIRGGRAYATRREADLSRDKISKKPTSNINAPPPLLDDHCRQCRKPFDGKMAVLMHQKKVHTGNCCPVIVCGHNFKDVARMEAHLRRHVEGNVTGKLETDDEGEIVERRVTRVTKRRTNESENRKRRAPVEEKEEDRKIEKSSAKPAKPTQEELWKKCKCTRIDWRQCVLQCAGEENEEEDERRIDGRRMGEEETEKESEEESEENEIPEVPDSDEEVANERVANWINALPSNQGLEEEVEGMGIGVRHEEDQGETDSDSDGSPAKRRRVMDDDDSDKTIPYTYERNEESEEEEEEDEDEDYDQGAMRIEQIQAPIGQPAMWRNATTEHGNVIDRSVKRQQNAEQYDDYEADYETETD